MSDLLRRLIVLLCAATVVGCRAKSVSEPVVPREPAQKPGVVAVDPTPPVEQISLTPRQEQALEKIVAAGGSIERAEDGSPSGLDLASERVFADDELVRAVLEFPHIKRLRVAVSKATPETLADLAKLSELEELFLQDAPFDDAALTVLLRALPELQRVALRRLSRVTDAGLVALPDCQQLDVVALIEMSGITGATLQTLQSVQRLRLLDLRNCGKLTTADFTQLATLGSLQELKLGGPAVNDDVLAIVAQHPSLSALSLEDAQVSSACLQRLAESRDMAGRLRSVSFTRCFGLKDESLHVLREFPKLESLTLREMMLTGSFLQYVHDAADEPLPLRTLVITDAFLTDEALTPLPAMFSALIRLDLSGNQGITDAVLGVLKQVRTLQEVRLDRTAVTGKWYPGGD